MGKKKKDLTLVGTTHGALLPTFHPSCNRSHPLQAPRATQNSNPSTSSPGGSVQKSFSCHLLSGLPGARGRGQLAHEAPEGKAKPELCQQHGAELTRVHPSPVQAPGGTRLCSVEIRAKRARQPPGTAGEAFPNLTEASQRPKAPVNGSRSSSEESQAPNPSTDPPGTGGSLHRKARGNCGTGRTRGDLCSRALCKVPARLC